MTALETLAGRLAAMRAGAKAATRQALMLHVADSVGAWVATAHMREARALDALRRRPGAGAAPGDPAPAIMVNCALARMSEIDDIDIAAMITPGAIVVPAALSIAASLPDSETEALCDAVLAGYEAMIRLGRALDGPAILYRGIWPTYLAAPFGVAAVASRLLNLDAGQTAHALALALTLAAPGVGHHNAPSGSRWLAIGATARNGWLAACAARAGFTADLAILDGPFLTGVYGIAADPEALTADGEPALLQVSFKPWCAARQTMAATQALREIAEEGPSAADISAIEAAIPPQFLRMVDHGYGDGDRLSRLTSLPYQLALALLDPGGVFHVAQTRPIAPEVTAMMGRITVRGDDALGRSYPASWPARVVVQAGGERLECRVNDVPGDPARPFMRADVSGKMQRVFGRKIGSATVAALIADCEATLAGRASPAQLLAAIEAARARVAAAAPAI